MAPRERQRQIALLVLGIVGLVLVIGGIGYLIDLFPATTSAGCD